jgi:hypothetical protein
MKKYALSVCFFLLGMSAFGTHLRGGYIQAVRTNQLGLTFQITITIYTDAGSVLKLGGDSDISYLYFGDGERTFVPETNSIIRYDLDPLGSIATATYVAEHTYSGFGTYLIRYQEPNRNGGVINATNTLSSLFYLETQITFDPFIPWVSTPVRITEPIFRTTAGDDFSFSLASKDSIDNSVFYELVSPRSAQNQPLENYELPENFSINPMNGLITWDTKFHGAYQVGEYAFAVRIYQFSGEHLTGYTTIDLQIILEDNDSGRLLSDNKELDENGRIYVESGSSERAKIFAEDPLADSVILHGFSELTNETLFDDALSFIYYDSAEGDRKITVGVLDVKNSEAILRDNPYAIVVRATYYRHNAEPFQKDLGYLFYTKDVELEYPDVILDVAEEDLSATFYPNPAKDFLYLDDEKVKSVRLMTLDGRQLIYHDCSDNAVVDLSQVKSGLYILQLSTRNNKQRIVRLIKE